MMDKVYSVDQHLCDHAHESDKQESDCRHDEIEYDIAACRHCNDPHGQDRDDHNQEKIQSHVRWDNVTG